MNKESNHFFFLSFTQQILLDASSGGLCVHQKNLFCFPSEIYISQAHLKVVGTSMELHSGQWDVSGSDVHHLQPSP